MTYYEDFISRKIVKRVGVWTWYNGGIRFAWVKPSHCYSVDSFFRQNLFIPESFIKVVLDNNRHEKACYGCSRYREKFIKKI